jgi:5-formyltetrahydrofolate cyclo-ligase
MKDKKILRKQMREIRDALIVEEIEVRSKQITEQLWQSSLYKECTHICVYEAFRNEVSCAYITKQALLDGKNVYLPVTDEASMTMEFYQITGDTVYREGNYGILEPELNENSMTLQQKALILMPGLAFDRNKNRLGYGGGYYDKYLSLHNEHITSALCYNFQIVDELPCEKHDILPDYIVTEQEIF